MTMEKYKNTSLPVEECVEDLLSKMTLKEKVGQLNQKMYGWDAYKKTDRGFELTKQFKEQVAFGDGMGTLYGLFRADPWSAVSFARGIPAEESAKAANMVQRYVIENTRLGIPVLLSEECSHGHQALDGGMLPTNIGAGATWNPELHEKAFSRVAAEIRAMGGNLGLVSTLDILRDPRWGRSEECFSEDPYLAAQMTAAAVKGLQGTASDDLKRPDKVAAVVKHFCAQGTPAGGHNLGPAIIGEREFREIFLPGMKAAVEAGAMACMAAYNEIDGLPCHGNRKLLTGILRDEWGFLGMVMADGYANDRLVMQAGDHERASAMALSAGVDMSLWDTSYTTIENAVGHGIVSEELVDRAVRRVLRLKFLLGLFENPYTDETLAAKVVGGDAFREVNLQEARECVVLLKNKKNILPLKKDLKKIAVIGPNADNLYNQLGDYTPTQREGTGFTVLQGIKSAVSGTTEIVYSKGCGIRDISKEDFADAIDAAKSSDVAILVLGGSSTRDFDVKFDSNGAAVISENPTEMDCGEGVDVADLKLGGVQSELAEEIAATGTPVIVVLIQGRPHAVPWIAENCNAVLCAWYPGKEGGRAIAEIIFGDINPSGKLPVTMPRSSAQLPVYYNQKDLGKDISYRDLTAMPLFPFGFGLSYTTFEYAGLRFQTTKITTDALERGETLTVHVDVKNTGSIAGAEVVQLYIKDMEASITRRIKELKGFKKVWLEPGEQKTVTFTLGKKELGVWNNEMRYVVEPGNIKVMAGGSSVDTIEAMMSLVLTL